MFYFEPEEWVWTLLLGSVHFIYLLEADALCHYLFPS